MKRLGRILSGGGFLVGVMMATSAWAQCNCYWTTWDGSCLPKFGQPYANPANNPVVFTDPSLNGYGISSILLYPVHTPIFNNWSSGPVGNCWQETFDGTVTGNAVINLLDNSSISGKIFGAGQTTVTLCGGYTECATGTFDTTMTLNASGSITWTPPPQPGSVSFWLTCTATGQTTILDNGNGTYEICSYFDVWPEISFDGYNWVAADNSLCMNLVPEPSSMVLLGLGALGLALRMRRARR